MPLAGTNLPADQFPSALDKTVEFAIGAAIEEEDPDRQELDENAPISKKDNAIKTLVNFTDLKKGKTPEEVKEKENAKPVYINAEEGTPRGKTGFVPSPTIPQANEPQPKAITFGGATSPAATGNI